MHGELFETTIRWLEGRKVYRNDSSIASVWIYLMLLKWRAALRDALPPRAVHAYRALRHTILWPTELEMVAAQRFLSRDTIAVDIGANMGLFTSVLARHCERVIAFEPNLSCARHLKKVLPSNCEIICKAVSDGCGTSVLRVPSQGGVALDALGTIEAENEFGTEGRVTDVKSCAVQTVSLDEALSRLTSNDRVGFINVDAEGHEFAVLRGSAKTLAAHRPTLLIELEYRHGSAVDEVIGWMKERQYAAFGLIDNKKLAPIDAATLRHFQSEDRLRRRLAGDRHAGYLNNVFFIRVPD